MTLRVLGIDPGLTRCGVGVVDVDPSRRARLVHVSVVRSSPDEELSRRLLRIGAGIRELLDEHRPAVVAIERVFAQQNVRSVMGVAQISGVALHAAAERDLEVAMHTPSEVKAAVTGYGNADKRQVGQMVARLLGLDAPPTPADASDALALAICSGWRRGPAHSAPGATGGTETPAQRAWREAAASAAARRLPR